MQSDLRDLSDPNIKLFNNVDDLEKFENLMKQFIKVNKDELSHRGGTSISSFTMSN
jgi:hypothetical protein